MSLFHPGGVGGGGERREISFPFAKDCMHVSLDVGCLNASLGNRPAPPSVARTSFEQTVVRGRHRSLYTETESTTNGNNVGGEIEKIFSYIISFKNTRMSFHIKTMTLYCGVCDLCIRETCDTA